MFSRKAYCLEHGGATGRRPVGIGLIAATGQSTSLHIRATAGSH